MLKKLKIRAGLMGHYDSYILLNKRSLIWGYQIWLCGQCPVCYSHNKAFLGNFSFLQRHILIGGAVYLCWAEVIL